MPETLLFLTELLGLPVYDLKGRRIGRVRVNDVSFGIRRENEHDILRVVDVDVGLRSIFRRLFQGVLPRRWIRRLQSPIPPHSIPWELCNIVEEDPQRRVRLNISHAKLEEIHPADLADIVEELSPDSREAIFETLDNEVAADALSEVDPKMQAAILESLETEKAADIVEEMSPHEAADVLAEMEEATSQEILE